MNLLLVVIIYNIIYLYTYKYICIYYIYLNIQKKKPWSDAHAPRRWQVVCVFNFYLFRPVSTRSQSAAAVVRCQSHLPNSIRRMTRRTSSYNILQVLIVHAHKFIISTYATKINKIVQYNILYDPYRQTATKTIIILYAIIAKKI